MENPGTDSDPFVKKDAGRRPVQVRLSCIFLMQLTVD
jgi:hypothetical protein